MDGKNKKESRERVVKEAQEFPLHELRAHSQDLFGVKPEILDGAFLNCKEANISKTDAESRIKTFLNKEVKQ